MIIKYTKDQADKYVEFYVRNGYVVFKDLLQIEKIEQIHSFVNERIQAYGGDDGSVDYHEIAVRIMDGLSLKGMFLNVTDHENVIDVMARFLGNDVAIFNYDALWINAPNDEHPVLNKGLHSDAWTGTSVNTIFAKFFLTDCDQYNGLTVAPGSHLQGLIPVRNRKIDEALNIKFETLNLATIKKGDLVIWHPLLLHSTTGHSNENFRISITCRYTSTETDFSSQERALGYRTLRVSPGNTILRLIGNDNLLPLRTYGGYVGIDKRMQGIYGNSGLQ